MPTPTTYMALQKPTVGADANNWGGYINADLDLIDALAVYKVVSAISSGALAVYNGPALIKATGGAGGITLTLPDSTVAANAGRVYIVIKTDAAVGAITLNGTGGQTISGQPTATISNQWEGLMVQADGSNWITIGIIRSVSGIISVSEGGTGADLSATGGTSQVVRQSTLGGAFTVGQLSFSDISGQIGGGQIASATITVAMLASVEGNGTKVQLTSAGATVSGDVVTYDGSGNVQDSGTLLSALATLASPTFTGTVALPTVTVSGFVTSYAGVATVGSGLPAEYAQIDLTAQTAAISSASLFAIPAGKGGQWRISWNAKVTTPDSGSPASSTLGGTNGFQVTYTDADDSVVVTTPAWWGGGNNGAAPSSAGDNTTQTWVGGSLVVNAAASSNLLYSFDYTASLNMAYSLHVKAERLG